MEAIPKFLQGVFAIDGAGYDKPTPLGAPAYTAPADKRAQLIYFRAGNSSGELIYLALLRDGQLMRYFPIGAKCSEHVSLAVVEDLPPESKLEVMFGGPSGVAATIVLDLGLVEI